MATNSVEYISCIRICCGDLPAPIILCIPAELVAPHLCPSTYGYSGSGGNSGSGGGGDAQPYDYTYMEADISSETEIKGACNKSSWRYIFTYDTAQLVDGAVLVGSSVEGVICKGCFTEWVEQIVGSEPYIETDADTGAQTFISPHGCEYPLNVGGGSASYQSLYVETDSSGVVCVDGVAETDLMSYTIEGGTLEVFGDRIIFKAFGAVSTDNAPPGEIKVKIGGTTVATFSVEGISEPDRIWWEINGEIIYNSDALAYVSCTLVNKLPETYTPIHFAENQYLTITLADPQDIVIVGQVFDVGDTLCQRAFTVDKVPAP